MNDLVPTLKLSLEMTDTLSRIERNGIRINLDTLDQIEKLYQDELDELELRLNDMARSAMGDTPISLTSPDDRSMLLYSRKVRDKKSWSSIFNLGMEQRGATMKPKQRTRMSAKDFRISVRSNTDVVYKTVGSRCATCLGFGRVRPVRKDGTPSKALRICKTCGGKGVVYMPTSEVAGFKIVPRNVRDVASAGFKTDKDTLADRELELSGDAREFASAYVRYNALRMYLGTFVEGMKNNVDDYGFIHPEFMQCVTATGRLSSRNPNFQNMPRGNTFEIRKVVESRFDKGKIVEGDYSQLEFRVAGFLGKDQQAYSDVEAGTDVHSYTASVIGCSRQEAKAHTFKPLYGGTSGTEAQQRYYKAFKEKYGGVTLWHDDLQREAVEKRVITLPSGRQYAFPDARWTKYGTATHRTNICNYPVQGFATADLLPAALVRLDKLFQENKLKSVICNTVHDSIVLDMHPDEKDICIKLMREAMLSLPEETQRRYGVTYDMPVEIEIKIGDNWLDLHVVS
jgi:DNA polymerase I-like protein with 3'-5' exonuclease and polymerase domains|tara:strand:- start:5373 stop:6908 length:1536 start_codon:yes stop_codon:yes gene_type:complete